MSNNGSPKSSEPLPKKREKGFMTSLKRFLSRRRAVDSASQLRSPPNSCVSKGSGSSELLCAAPADAYESAHGCKAPPRSSASMPLLFPPTSSSANLLPSFGASPLPSGVGRRALPANSTATFLQLPAIEPCAAALSTGAMADRVTNSFLPSPLHQHSSLATNVAELARLRSLAAGGANGASPRFQHQNSMAGPAELPERSTASVPLPVIHRIIPRGSGATFAVEEAPPEVPPVSPPSAAAAAASAAAPANRTPLARHVSATSISPGTATAPATPIFPGTAAAAAAATLRTATTSPIGSPNVISPHRRPGNTETAAMAVVAAPAAAPALAAAAAMEASGSSSTSTLLAVCPGAPAAMRRPVWRLRDYSLSGRLYKGEVSAVYKAVCGLSGVKVVLKVYSLSRVADNALHTIVREVRIHTDLNHDNVLMMYGVFEEENRLVLVLERAARGDLFHLHRSLPNCRMSEDQLRVLVLAPLLDALVYLHGRGVCHRDIKPENLLMTGGWQLKVADFGAAIDLTQERAVTRTGTMDYMAPEVERCPLKLLPGDNKDDPSLAYSTAADVWSVGVLAYEMLVGFPPFINCSAAAAAGEGGGGGGFGAGGSGRRELCFPHFVSAGGQDFISCALAERPEDRPTASQLLHHPWLKHALRQHQARQQQQQQQQQEQQEPAKQSEQPQQ